MGVLTIMNELRTRFNAEWADAYPVAWPNVAFSPVIGSPWVRFSVNTYATDVIDIGSTTKVHRTLGIIYIQVFVPKNEGDALGVSIAEQAASVFNTWCGQTVRCRAAKVKIIGEAYDNDDWFQVNASIPFVQDEQI